jgi:hypothetical protein
MVQYVGEHAKEYITDYGNISAASIGAIQRNLLILGEQGAEKFFGEPMLDIHDLMQTVKGEGVINILAADKLMNSPRVYSTFLLWLMSSLFEHLPEVGDVEKPKLIFFFDESHLLFNEAPPALIEKIEQVVRLIRSKGVGIYFVTQNPDDVPASILSQLGNRVQHALRAFTPRDQKAVKTAAQTLRPNPDLDAVKAITELEVGEALISFLDAKGRPNIVERAFVLPPLSRIGPLTVEERQKTINDSLVFGVYERVRDRESAYERLMEERARKEEVSRTPSQGQSGTKVQVPEPRGGWSGDSGNTYDQDRSSAGRIKTPARAPAPRHDSALESVAKSAGRAIGSTVGREIVRGILGSILGGSRKR